MYKNTENFLIFSKSLSYTLVRTKVKNVNNILHAYSDTLYVDKIKQSIFCGLYLPLAIISPFPLVQ